MAGAGPPRRAPSDHGFSRLKRVGAPNYGSTVLSVRASWTIPADGAKPEHRSPDLTQERGSPRRGGTGSEFSANARRGACFLDGAGVLPVVGVLGLLRGVAVGSLFAPDEVGVGVAAWASWSV